MLFDPDYLKLLRRLKRRRCLPPRHSRPLYFVESRFIKSDLTWRWRLRLHTTRSVRPHLISTSFSNGATTSNNQDQTATRWVLFHPRNNYLINELQKHYVHCTTHDLFLRIIPIWAMVFQVIQAWVIKCYREVLNRDFLPFKLLASMMSYKPLYLWASDV